MQHAGTAKLFGCFQKFLNRVRAVRVNVAIYIRDHSFSTYAKSSEKLTFLTTQQARALVRVRE